MTSIVIAAHNEEAVLGHCLDALLAQQDADVREIIVVANGCTDQTAAIARQRQAVRLVETAQAGKANALNLGDRVAVGFPRVYLDADIVLSPVVIGALTEALATDPNSCAAVPGRRLDVTGRPVIVRAYTAISARLPAFRDGLFGRGVIALSERGRSMFDEFPTMIADDLFLDSQFAAGEKVHVEQVTVTVETPRRTRDLFQRLVRVRRGNAQLRAAAADGSIATPVRSSDRTAWLTDVVLREPKLLPAGVIYAGVTLLVGFRAKHAHMPYDAWGRDDSTRTPLPPSQGLGPR